MRRVDCTIARGFLPLLAKLAVLLPVSPVFKLVVHAGVISILVVVPIFARKKRIFCAFVGTMLDPLYALNHSLCIGNPMMLRTENFQVGHALVAKARVGNVMNFESGCRKLTLAMGADIARMPLHAGSNIAPSLADENSR